ncbi:MAG: hypothetical protein GY796_13125 [Chloroflexi bacterium]|nr:hypothetical protein [Chloroflexota bacterium]
MSNDRRQQRIARRRGRKWAEMLMENSSLRDNLNDEQAQELLNWGLAQVKASAVATADLPTDEAEQLIEKNGTAVKLIMQGVNDLIGGIGQPLDFDLIDDTMTRLLKNHRWLTDQPLTQSQLQHHDQFNQAREAEDREAAFQHLMGLIETHDS